MSIALEIITDGDNNIDLDSWCQFAKVEGRKLIGNMRFGTEVVGTDSPEIVAMKRAEAADDCDKFFDAIEPYAGKTVTVIYDAARVAVVTIPEDGGLNSAGDLIEWDLTEEVKKAYDGIPKEPWTPAPPIIDAGITYKTSDAELITAIKELTEAVKELKTSIDGKRKKA